MRGPLLCSTLAALALLSCERPAARVAENPFTPLYGQLITEAPLLVVPDHRWQTEGCEEGAWGFRGLATLLFNVAEPLDADLTVLLEPAGGQRLRLAATLDGTEWRAPSDPGGTTTVTLPAAALSSRHHLTLQPRDPGDRRLLCFRLAYRIGEHEPIAVAASDRERLQRIAAFLTRSVMGRESVMTTGTLFVGKARHERELEVARAGTARFELENWSSAPALFRASSGSDQVELELAGGENGSLLLALESGRRTVALEVAGDDRGLFVWGRPHLSPDEPRERTPVFVITLDTTRRDALSVYGAATPTPNIAAFAEHAVVYDHAIAAAPWTLPSHASIFTGLFPSRHGAGVRDEHLARSIPTLAERFREHGYRTAGFVGGALAASQWGIARGFQTYVDPAGWEVRGDRLTDDVIAFLEAAKGEPVFVFANYFDAHSSYRAPEPFRSQLDLPAKEAAVASHPEFGPLSRGDNSPWSRVVDGKTEITDAAIDWITAAYHAEVAYLDHQLGRLLGTLKRLDLYDRALIVLVADHGEFLGEHGFFSHSCRLDAELIDIPLLIKWPHQSSGRRSADLVSHVDLFPTLLETLAERPDGIDGIAVAQRRDRAAARPPALFEEHEFRIHPFFEYMKIDAHLYGRQEPTFREVVWKDGASCERRNDGVWQDADCRQAPDRLLAELSAQLLGPNPPVDALASGPQPASPELTNSRESGMTPEQLENLRALGYVPE